LCKLVAPIDKLTSGLPSMGCGLKSGQLNEAGINSAAQDISSLKGTATQLGAPITERVPPSVGVPWCRSAPCGGGCRVDPGRVGLLGRGISLAWRVPAW